MTTPEKVMFIIIDRFGEYFNKKKYTADQDTSRLANMKYFSLTKSSLPGKHMLQSIKEECLFMTDLSDEICPHCHKQYKSAEFRVSC